MWMITHTNTHTNTHANTHANTHTRPVHWYRPARKKGPSFTTGQRFYQETIKGKPKKKQEIIVIVIVKQVGTIKILFCFFFFKSGSVTEFYRVFDCPFFFHFSVDLIDWDLPDHDRMGFLGFRISHYADSIVSIRLLTSFTEFYRVLLSLTRFCWVLLGFGSHFNRF